MMSRTPGWLTHDDIDKPAMTKAWFNLDNINEVKLAYL